MAREKNDKWLPPSKRDWAGIKADYETGARTINDMEEHYLVPRHTIMYRAKTEKWKRGRTAEEVAKRKTELMIENEVASLENRGTRPGQVQDDEPEGALDVRHGATRAQVLPGIPQAELQQAAAMMQALGLTPPGTALTTMTDAEREALAIELAARRHVEVTKSHKKTLGRLHALIDKTILRLEKVVDGDESAMVLSEKETVGGLLRDLSGALAKLVPLERQVHGLDTQVDQVSVFLPYVGKREVPSIDADFTEVPGPGPVPLARVDIRRQRPVEAEDGDEMGE